MAAQGVDYCDMIWSEGDYRLYNFLAGNMMTTSVVGACITALVLGCLCKGSDGECLG